MTRDELIDKIRKVGALFRRTDSPGEMQAARGALDRLKAQLAQAPEPTTEWPTDAGRPCGIDQLRR